MTFWTYSMDHLERNGMSNSQATEVMRIASEEMDEMRNRWTDGTSEYPDIMKPSVRMNIDSYAVRWIDENLPLAWYRPIFAHDDIKSLNK